MTICVTVKVPEGLIFASDSVVTLTQTTVVNNQPTVLTIQDFKFANKLTQVKDYPIGVMSWGLASLSERTIHSLIMEFELTYPNESQNPNHKVEIVANDLILFVKQRYDKVYQTAEGQKIPPEQRILGLVIGGFSSNTFFAEQYVYEFPKSDKLIIARPDLPDGNPNFGANWYGLTDALIRLIKGYDLASLEKLISRGANKDIVQKWMDDNVSELPLVFNGMPLQDAIDFAEYCVQVVIGRYRFSPGSALCGGDIDIAVIRPNSFKWSKHKQWAIKD